MSSTNLESEYKDIKNRNAWLSVYQKICRECLQHEFSCLEAKKPQNKALNRYRNVDPYDHSRVVLIRSSVDYINANLVKMEKANRRYILTQGPLASTISHFWLMIWEQKSKAILMLSKIIERNEIKCHMYWPQEIGSNYKLELDNVNLTVELTRVEHFKHYVTRYFNVCDLESNETREVIQFHYTTWPDFSVPSSPLAFLDFLKKVRDSGALESDVGPAIVHCSAGIGRSGTFCLVDSCLILIEKEGLNSVNVQEVLLEMRKDRMGLIQTPDQLRFSYEAIIEGAKRLDSNYTPGTESENFGPIENIYEEVSKWDEGGNEEEPPPPPPPRAESLASRPPARPLPTIPNSESLGELPMEPENGESSSDSVSAGTSDSEASSEGSSDDEPPPDKPTESGEKRSPDTELRRRKAEELADRVATMKRKQQESERKRQESERWQAFKRSLYKPLTITFGALIATFFVYAFIKH